MATVSKIALFYVTKKGRLLAERVAGFYPDATYARLSGPLVKEHWTKGSGLVFVMAAGVVVRTIAPLLKDKRTDPAIVVLDELGEHAVSLLSGHVGGANALARDIAAHLHARPVITTASDASNLPSIDLWAEEQGLEIEDWKQLPPVATRLLDRGTLRLFSEVPLDTPLQFVSTGDPDAADLIVTNRALSSCKTKHAVVIRPKNLVAGVGCNSNTSESEIEEAVKHVLDEEGFSHLSLRAIATIDKKGNEPGLCAFALGRGLPLLLFSPEELNQVPGVSPSEAARKATGAQAVAEPSAILGTNGGELLMKKRRMGNVTVALASDGPGRELRSTATERGSGILHVVGIGPGSADDITPRALKAIRDSDVVVGYGPYLDLIGGLVSGKETVSTGMTREADRCRQAVQLAREGRNVSVVSGGDPGIYAMAGLVLELLRKDGQAGLPGLTVRIIPGVSALNACAALAGAPLMHDFATISLSDRLTSWHAIEGRLDAAAREDFVIVLYNPKSRGRATHINKAREIILRHRAGTTPVAIVKSATREDEKVLITDLGHMPFDEIDMRTTVIIGNSKSAVWKGFMITPRGYENKDSRKEQS
jgi:cobalt-precorrin 5A hydrolase / precorrin-3B C17-methyltransferase